MGNFFLTSTSFYIVFKEKDDFFSCIFFLSPEYFIMRTEFIGGGIKEDSLDDI
jgi:hypothetical protein